MQITLKTYLNHSEPNKLDKDLTEKDTFTGILKENCDILNPVILVQTDNYQPMTKINYMWVQEFDRNYFITKVEYVRGKLWRIYAHVDVLSTYKDQIRSLNGVISRQENKWNLYIDDDIFKVYQNPQIITKKFPQGFDRHSYVLAISGG